MCMRTSNKPPFNAKATGDDVRWNAEGAHESRLSRDGKANSVVSGVRAALTEERRERTGRAPQFPIGMLPMLLVGALTRTVVYKSNR